jgi:hypothetical protein
MSREHYAAALKECVHRIDALHTEIRSLTKERAVAAATEGRVDRCGNRLPWEIIHGSLMVRCHGCPCEALRMIAHGKDGMGHETTPRPR